MVINALDEVLFWADVSRIINKIKEWDRKYFPDNPEMFSIEKEKFIKQEIPTKENFLHRLEYYEKNGKPIWVGGRNDSCDDLSFEDIKRSVTESASLKHGEILAKKLAPIYSKNPDFWKFYTDNVFTKKKIAFLN